jgi:CubicO group peptidase (beta-lactamase class C family)
MQRREFIGASAALGLAAMETSRQLAWGGTTTPNEPGSGPRPTDVQSEEGVVIHPFDSDVMRGNPPTKESLVTLDTYESIHGHRIWGQQHMRELCPTQIISRGTGPVSVLPRKPTDVVGLRMKDLSGNALTVQQFLEKSFTDAFLVLHRGQILTEEYFSGMKPDTLHRTYSVSKSLLADVVAVLLDEGVLHEHAPVTEYIPELNVSAYTGATVRQLLDMESGVKFEYELENAHQSLSEHGRHFRAAGMFRKLPGEDPDAGQYDFFATLKDKVREHGAIFSYKCSDTGVLAWACERVTGVRFADLLSDRIWSRLGAEHDASTVCDVQGATTPHGGFSITLRDLARWGQIHLQEGTCLGRKLVPKTFIDDMRHNAEPAKVTQDSFPPPDGLWPGWAYRSQFWLPHGKHGPYLAWGGYGQLCYIHPDCDTVIVKFSAHKTVDVELGKLELHACNQIAQAVGK